jgi:DNA-binding GntR family transcriptional regulator
VPTIASHIYLTLADEIIGGVHAPGRQLEEKALAERFAASRTPVREALRELAARGLIELVPRKGGVVAPLGLGELAELLDAECELEALCARLAAQRMTTVEKKQLERLHAESEAHVASGDVHAYLAANHRFHDAVAAGTHNRTIVAMARALRDRLMPFRRAQTDVEDRLAISHDEHTAVVRAILAADVEAADATMRDHNARLGSHVLERMRAAQERAQAGTPAGASARARAATTSGAA